ncbi:MAG TPA: DUF1622 domain-containing protein [Candidatus Nitrosocosmicus sp.]
MIFINLIRTYDVLGQLNPANSRNKNLCESLLSDLLLRPKLRKTMTFEKDIPLPWEELFRPFLNYLILGIDITSCIVIAISIIRGFIMYIKTIRESPLKQTKEEEGIKRYVGNGLILALDLEVGSDIIKTILTPSQTELLALVVIVAIRISLSWSLSKDMRTDLENQ